MKRLRIPHERIGVLIGRGGEVKGQIENITGIRIDVDSSSGEVFIDDSNAIDPVFSLRIVDVITAIGRGFSPHNALRLLEDNVSMRVIDIRDYGSSPGRVRELKARVIGRRGKTRSTIEALTETSISVYGHTVAIIGADMDLDVALYAVDMILSGSKHGRVYSYLEKKAKELRMMKRLAEVDMVGNESSP